MREILLAACLIAPACSSPDRSLRDSEETLCAAEALKGARASRPNYEREARLRREVDLFTNRLEEQGLLNASERIDELADHSAGRALIAPAACQALLTTAERTMLDTPAEGPFTNLQRSSPRGGPAVGNSSDR